MQDLGNGDYEALQKATETKSELAELTDTQ